jgi:hypothetical protein
VAIIFYICLLLKISIKLFLFHSVYLALLYFLFRNFHILEWFTYNYFFRKLPWSLQQMMPAPCSHSLEPIRCLVTWSWSHWGLRLTTIFFLTWFLVPGSRGRGRGHNHWRLDVLSSLGTVLHDVWWEFVGHSFSNFPPLRRIILRCVIPRISESAED